MATATNPFTTAHAVRYSLFSVSSNCDIFTLLVFVVISLSISNVEKDEDEDDVPDYLLSTKKLISFGGVSDSFLEIKVSGLGLKLVKTPEGKYSTNGTLFLLYNDKT